MPTKEELLADAMDNRDIDSIRELLEVPEIDLSQSVRALTPAQRAAKYGSVELLQKLKDKGIDLNYKKEGDITPLENLIAEILLENYDISQFSDVICFLLNNGATIEEIVNFIEGIEDPTEEELATSEQILEVARKCFEEPETNPEDNQKDHIPITKPVGGAVEECSLKLSIALGELPTIFDLASSSFA